MSVSIKTVFDGNIHRFNLTKPSYDELEVALNSIYGKRGFSIRYQDEDGDMINVSSSLELQEALRVAGGKTLKLILSLAGGDAFVCVNEPEEPVASEPAVVHVEPQAEKKATDASEPAPKAETPKVETKAEEKKREEPELNCEEIRALACQFLSDPAVQVVLPELVKTAITQVVEGARNKKDPQEAAARVLEVFTTNNVIQGQAVFAAVQPFLGKVQAVLSRVLENIPPAFVDLLDRLKDGFQFNADMLMSLLSNPFPTSLDCGKFDLGALGLSFASLPALASFPFGPFEFGFECKSPCQEDAPKESSPDTHSTVRCDGCNAFPIVGPRYNCTVCPDFDLCAKCEAAGIHPVEHPLLKLRQAASQVVVHHGITCDGCNQSPITGVRFKCRTCHDYDLCETCEAKNTHPADHPLVKFKTPRGGHGRHFGQGGNGGHGGFGGRHLLHKLFKHAMNPEAFGRGFQCGGRRRFLAQGAMGPAVKEIQQALGIQADGFFGPKTEQAVKDFQAANALDADGIVGPRTRAKLFFFPEKKDEATSAPPSSPKEAAKPEQPKEAPKEAPKPSAPPAPVAVEIDPALVQLAGMGFTDMVVNARLVKKYNGDLEQVVAELLGA